MTADEVKEKLINDHGVNKSELRGKKKVELLEMLHNMPNPSDESPSEELFNMPESDDKTPNIEFDEPIQTMEEAFGAKYGSPEYQEKVMSLLNEGEYYEKDGRVLPKAFGLRRVAEEILGPIISAKPTSVQYHNTDDICGRAIVTYEVTFDFRFGL